MYLNNSGVKFSAIEVASTSNKLSFAGKTVSQIAKNMGTSSEQAVLNLIQNGGSEVLVFEKNLDPEQVNHLWLEPLGFIGTDGAGFGLKGADNRLVHPRCFGTVAKFLNETFGKGALDIESAIKKLASGPAKKLGLKKRGEIKIGNFADLVIFDKDKIKDSATYQNPYQSSQGMDYVFVNGKAAVSEGKITSQLPGYILRKN